MLLHLSTNYIILFVCWLTNLHVKISANNPEGLKHYKQKEEEDMLKYLFVTWLIYKLQYLFVTQLIYKLRYMFVTSLIYKLQYMFVPQLIYKLKYLFVTWLIYNLQYLFVTWLIYLLKYIFVTWSIYKLKYLFVTYLQGTISAYLHLTTSVFPLYLWFCIYVLKTSTKLVNHH